MQTEDGFENISPEQLFGELHEGHFDGRNCDLTWLLPDNELFAQLIGKDVLLVMNAVQLNILGQTFRPVFTGRLTYLNNGYITLDPAILKISTAPFFCFPTPLNFPISRIAYIGAFDRDIRFPIA